MLDSEYTADIDDEKIEMGDFPSYPDHNTEGEGCWCDPEIIEMENGNKVIIHRGDN
jgi:hypothetical protein